MTEFKNRLRIAMQRKGIKQVELSRRSGLPKSAISQYLQGLYKPKHDRMAKLAEILEVSEGWLDGHDVPIEPLSDELKKNNNIISIENVRQLPLVGKIACGKPILAEEHIKEFINVPANVNATCAIRCEGDSMINARIFDGDIVFIDTNAYIENGQIAAVLINEPGNDEPSDATLKRLYLYDNRIELRAENPIYQPLIFEGEDRKKVHIFGKAVGFLGKL